MKNFVIKKKKTKQLENRQHLQKVPYKKLIQLCELFKDVLGYV